MEAENFFCCLLEGTKVSTCLKIQGKRIPDVGTRSTKLILITDLIIQIGERNSCSSNRKEIHVCKYVYLAVCTPTLAVFKQYNKVAFREEPLQLRIFLCKCQEGGLI